MHDADLVGRAQPVEHRRSDVDGARDAERVLALEQVSQRLARDVLHHVERHPGVAGARVGDVDDVGVAEPRERTPLLTQAADQILAPGELAEERLEHEALAELGVLHQINGAHPARAEQAVHPVTSAGDDFAVAELPHVPRRSARST